MLRLMACAGLAAALIGCAGTGGGHGIGARREPLLSGDDESTLAREIASLERSGPRVDADLYAEFSAAVSELEASDVSVKSRQDDEAAKKKADKTGTNPINFTFDFRIYNEYQWLNTKGDGNRNISTLEFRAPILDGQVQFRVKARYQTLEADLDGDGLDDVDESGIGDVDFRFITVPIMNMEKKFALAVGLEVFLDTASEGVLGSGATSLGPQVFGVFFKPLGGFFDLIAPAYQHKFSIEADNGRSHVHQSLIDVFGLRMSADKKQWILVNPTLILDHSNDTKFLLVDVEVGTMLDSLLGTNGHSVYLRPGFAIGGDRPTDYSIEFGYKIIF